MFGDEAQTHRAGDVGDGLYWCQGRGQFRSDYRQGSEILESWAALVGKVKRAPCINPVFSLSVSPTPFFLLSLLFTTGCPFLFCFVSSSTPCLRTWRHGLNWGHLSHQSCNYMQISQTPSLSWGRLYLDSLANYNSCIFTQIKEAFSAFHLQLW